MTDIAKRLREEHWWLNVDGNEAAHEIERLRAEREELLAALNLARICLKNRDQSEREAAAYAAICAAIAKAEGQRRPTYRTQNNDRGE